MRWITLALACFWSFAVEAGERDCITSTGGCTAFVVEGDLLVTAKHCKHPAEITVALQGQTVVARKVYETTTVDGPVVFRLERGGFASLPVAAAPPAPKDRVWTIGYPALNYSKLEGRILGDDGSGLVNLVDFRIFYGHSGGPLLNERGEVIGVALHVPAIERQSESGFAGWGETTKAIAAAKALIDRVPPQKFTRDPEVVVLTEVGCAPCVRLHTDVDAGAFPGYRFTFVTWDPEAKRWSDGGAMYAEFKAATGAKLTAFPTIWMRGTANHRSSYDGNRGGLLGWLENAVKFIIESFVGRPPAPLFAPEPELGAPATEIDPDKLGEIEGRLDTEIGGVRAILAETASDLADTRDLLAKTKADYEAFREAGVVGKIKAIARLKGDKEEALVHVEALRGNVDKLRAEWDEHPFQFLFGLIGVLSGLAHRRFAN